MAYCLVDTKPLPEQILTYHQLDGLVQERRNSSVLAMELRLSCINPSNWSLWDKLQWDGNEDIKL